METMFSLDQLSSWWTLLVTVVIMICIYQVLRNDRKPKNASSSSKKQQDADKLHSIPVFASNDYDQIYSHSTLQRASSRIDHLIASFRAHFDEQSPDFIVRSPGRVNLIGEHIDYCGYHVLPMAIEKDILFAVKCSASGQQNIIDLCNKDCTQFPSIQIDLSSDKDTSIKIGVEHRHWSHYFLAAFKGVDQHFADEIKQYKSLQIMVDGNIPKGSGLSSSSAFVCGSAVSLLFANLSEPAFAALDQSEIAQLCIDCERNVGVDSGGMDQTICMTANRGYAKYIQFRPELSGLDIKLPSNEKVRWVITNCLLEHELMDDKGTRNYNTRVVECRLAAVLLAKLLNLKQWRQVLTLRDVQDITHMELDQLLFRSMDLLDNEPYSFEQIEEELECDALGITLEDLMVGLKTGKKVLANLRKLEGKYRLPLQQRALHVYSEANRVCQFRDICMTKYGKEQKENQDEDDKVIRKLGKLMNDSHASCKQKYECSCDELDDLQSLCVEAGALGSRLTGAGWGGCLVSLVEVEKVKQFISHLNKNYYASIAKVPLDHIFTTSPSAALSVLQLA